MHVLKVKPELLTGWQKAEVGTLRVCLVLYFLPNLFQHQGFSARSKSFVECHIGVVRLLIK